MKSLPKPGDDLTKVVRIPRELYKHLTSVITRCTSDYPAYEETLDVAKLNQQAVQEWLEKPKGRELYERGMKHGFNIKRYRVSLWWEDGTTLKLMEQEDAAACKKYTDNLIAGKRERGYWVALNDDSPPVPCVYKSEGGEFMCKIILAVVTDNDAHFAPTQIPSA